MGTVITAPAAALEFTQYTFESSTAIPSGDG